MDPFYNHFHNDNDNDTIIMENSLSNGDIDMYQESFSPEEDHNATAEEIFPSNYGDSGFDDYISIEEILGLTSQEDEAKEWSEEETLFMVNSIARNVNCQTIANSLGRTPQQIQDHYCTLFFQFAPPHINIINNNSINVSNYGNNINYYSSNNNNINRGINTDFYYNNNNNNSVKEDTTNKQTIIGSSSETTNNNISGKEEGEGRLWNQLQHQLFLVGKICYPSPNNPKRGDWKSVSHNIFHDRITPTQLASHNQKFLAYQEDNKKSAKKRNPILEEDKVDLSWLREYHNQGQISDKVLYEFYAAINKQSTQT